MVLVLCSNMLGEYGFYLTEDLTLDEVVSEFESLGLNDIAADVRDVVPVNEDEATKRAHPDDVYASVLEWAEANV